ncbi:MAG: hypothetical protein A7315_15350 [Candidatus Altiarchaeales archaeon WOR_SM1_79]|nr:MAG: hypothetical protein A7315_15350 [Candidatus Altiarchaeales archaeon WOR_SM1_79]
MEININYKAVEARRNYFPEGNVEIRNNATITNMSKKDDKFMLNLNEEDKHAVGEWEKSGRKKMPDAMMQKINHIMISNCMIEATVLSRDVKLPAPLPPIIPPQPAGKKEDNKFTGSYIR